MPKRITFNFWRIEMPQNERRPFELLIEEAGQVTGLQNRLRPLGGYPIRAERIEAASGAWIGEMLKLRMDEIPAKAGLTTPIADLGLRADEGVGEPNGFLFDPNLNILITHGEHFGVSAGKVVEYFAEISHSRGPIHVEPVLTEDAWGKFRRMTTVKAISYRIGRNINRARLTGTGHSLARSVETIGDYDGLQMEVQVSVGRSRTHRMDKERLEGDITALMACYDEDHQSVQKLTVSGVNSEGTTEEVDFLEARMKVVIDVDLGEERRLTYDRRKIQLFRALRERSDELERIYGAVDAVAEGEAVEEFLEACCPWAGCLAFAACFFVWGSAIDLQKMPPLFTVVITVSAISVGFLGTAKAILISISNHKLMRTLKDTGQHRRLMDYLLSAMWSALFLVVLSAFYLLLDFQANAPSTTLLLSLWFALTGYALFSNARLIYIFSRILRYL